MILLPSGSQLAPELEPGKVPAGQVGLSLSVVAASPLLVPSATLLSPDAEFSEPVVFGTSGATKVSAGSLLVSSA